MGLFTKVFKKSTVVERPPPCPHVALVPRWDDLDDLGKADRITRYLCTACGSLLTVQEAQSHPG